MKNPTAIMPWLTLFLFALVATVGTFAGGIWASAGIGGAILLYGLTVFQKRTGPQPAHNFLALTLAALAIMALLNFFSYNPAQSWFDLWRLFTIFVPLLLLSCRDVQARALHPRLFDVLPLALTIGTVALGLELSLDAPLLHITKGLNAALTEYNRGLSYVVVLSFAALAALIHKPATLPRTTHIAILALFFVPLFFATGLTESRAAKLALMVGLAVAGVAWFVPRFVQAMLGGLVLALPAWPFVVQKMFLAYPQAIAHLPPSWHARVEIWDYMSYRIMEKPWLGWGLGTSKYLDFHNPHGSIYVWTEQAAPHPHNVVTQLWVELGIPGLLLGLAFAFLTLRQAGRLSAPLAPFALGAWTAMLCLSLVAYNFWTDSLFAAMALTGFGFALLERRHVARART